MEMKKLAAAAAAFAALTLGARRRTCRSFISRC